MMSSGVSLDFGPSRRLSRHAEFVRAQRTGRRVSTAHFTLLVAAQPPGRDRSAPSRLGIVAARKIGGAVARNRIKRLCRECFRRWPDLLPCGVDLIVIARPGAPALGLAGVEAEWRGVEPLLKRRAREALAQDAPRHHLAGGKTC